MNSQLDPDPYETGRVSRNRIHENIEGSTLVTKSLNIICIIRVIYRSTVCIMHIVLYNHQVAFIKISVSSTRACRF